MALFKISKGSKANLPDTLTEGFCWYTYDDSKFYIDHKDENGVLVRKALNAQDAETLMGASLSTILNSSDVEIPTSSAVFNAIEALKVELTNQSVAILSEAQRYTDNAIANIDISEGFSGSYNDLTDKPTIPTVPTNVSAFENDAGYLTAVPDEYITESELNDALANVGGGASSWNNLTDKPFEETTEGIKTLDEKFIPDTIARVAAIAEALEEAKTDASNKVAVVLAETQKAIDNKVDKIEGKGLSTNDFTDEYKNTLDNLGDRNFDDIITSNNELHETVREFTELVTAIRTQRTQLMSSFTLLASSWVEGANYYSQKVTISGVTDASVVDLRPAIAEILDMQEHGIALVAENDDGIVTIYALNGKPTRDYTMQAIITDIATTAEGVEF